MRRLLKAAITAALLYEGYESRAEVSVTLTDDEEIHILNKQYRNVDRPTDVLSFPLNEAGETDDDGDDTDALGDIVISVERAAKQAEEYGHSLDRELAFLAVHSTLHLLGYDHETPDEERDMFSRQEAILDSMGLSRRGKAVKSD